MTLVELLVAISIMALVAVLGWRGLETILRSQDALNTDLVRLRNHQLTFSQMEADFAQLVPSATLDGEPTLSIAPDRLLLVRSVEVDNAPLHYQVVGYRNDGGVLARSASPATRDRARLLAEWQAALAGTAAALPVMLESQVARLDLRTWNGEWRREGGTAAARSRRAASPRRVVREAVDKGGIEVSLLMQGEERPIVRVFFLGAG